MTERNITRKMLKIVWTKCPADIICLRNDNVYKGDLYDGDDTIGLPPGIYKVISEKIEGHDSDLGEIYLLTPGEAVIMNVDYTSLKATITNDENTK